MNFLHKQKRRQPSETMHNTMMAVRQLPKKKKKKRKN